VTRGTLLRYSESMMARMFGPDWSDTTFTRTDDGYIFLDRDAEAFRGVLRFLRTGVVPFSRSDERANAALREELDYWALPWNSSSGTAAGLDQEQEQGQAPPTAGSTRAGYMFDDVAIKVEGLTEDPDLARKVMRAAASIGKLEDWPALTARQVDTKTLDGMSRRMIDALPATHAWIIRVSPADAGFDAPIMWSTSELAPICLDVTPNGGRALRMVVFGIEK
jgi:hypothetical protein